MNVSLNRRVQIRRWRTKKRLNTGAESHGLRALLNEQLGIRMASIESRLTSIERGIESIMGGANHPDRVAYQNRVF